ncbi:MAG TPA: PAS domain-containing protein [Thermodesulfobacteriota bacterium]|nr:PAS domain-containing protein [Thermodesulfobacteriota bacterium]
MQRRDREVQTKNGHWYLMRATPYRSLDNLIEGLVIVFLDIDQYKKGCDAGQKLNT